MLFLVAYVAEFRDLPGDSEWLTMKKKKSSGYIVVQIKFHYEELRTWKCFCYSEITLKVMLLLDIRFGKVLRECECLSFLQLRKHKAPPKRSNLSNYKSKNLNYLLASWVFFCTVLPLARSQLPLGSGIRNDIMIMQPSSRNLKETKARWLYFNILLK